MRQSTKDRIEGKYHETKGKVKEATGRATDNPKVTFEGKAEKVAGKLQSKGGKIGKNLER